MIENQRRRDVSSRLVNVMYPYLPQALHALERFAPVSWRRRLIPDTEGQPPAELRACFPGYHVDAAAFHLQSRWLHDAAFGISTSTLHRFVAERVEVDMDALRGWMNGPRGAIFACPHYGPFLGAALLFAAEGTPARPANVFYDAPGDVPHNERFDVLFERFATTLTVLHNEPSGLMKAARALRNRQCISIMFDVVQRPMECMYVPFFNRLYPAMGGTAYLSLLSKAPVIPAYAVPLPNRCLRIQFGSELRPEDFSHAQKEQSIFAMTCALFKDFERQLTMAPWHWIYWRNVQHSPRYTEGVWENLPSLRTELDRRLKASPRLLKLTPALGKLVDACRGGVDQVGG